MTPLIPLVIGAGAVLLLASLFDDQPETDDETEPKADTNAPTRRGRRRKRKAAPAVAGPVNVDGAGDDVGAPVAGNAGDAGEPGAAGGGAAGDAGVTKADE